VYDVTNMGWSKQWAITQLDNGLRTTYWGGPTHNYKHGSSNPPSSIAAGANVIAHYNFDINNSPVTTNPAIISYNSNNARTNMLLFSAHLEAVVTEGLWDGVPFWELTTAEQNFNFKWLMEQLNLLMGTSFSTGAAFVNYQCSDGIDNDGDGYTDMNDAGCISFTDNSESLAGSSNSVLLFHDDFDTTSFGTNWVSNPTGTHAWSINTGSAHSGTKFVSIPNPQSAGTTLTTLHAVTVTAGASYLNVTYWSYVTSIKNSNIWTVSGSSDNINWLPIVERSPVGTSANCPTNGLSGYGDCNLMETGWTKHTHIVPTSMVYFQFICGSTLAAAKCQIDDVYITAI
jgi:hypothetical protein